MILRDVDGICCEGNGNGSGGCKVRSNSCCWFLFAKLSGGNEPNIAPPGLLGGLLDLFVVVVVLMAVLEDGFEIGGGAGGGIVTIVSPDGTTSLFSSGMSSS